ncbi:hypothetical protein TNCV_1289171 [Trichonephila clavipes]|nr:hypothetical protein TNCV_1289171 [Trichonephila clavipes]
MSTLRYQKLSTNGKALFKGNKNLARTDDDGHFSKSAKDAPQRSSVSWTLVGSPYHGLIFPVMDSRRISVPWTYLTSHKDYCQCLRLV